MLGRSAAYLSVHCIRFSVSFCLVLGIGPLEAALAAFPMCMCGCVRVFARTMCQNEIECTIMFDARRRSVSCRATDSNFPRAVVRVCVCGWCFVPNENIQLFVVIQQLLHQDLSITATTKMDTLAHTVDRVPAVIFALIEHSKRTKLVYWRWWCHSVVSAGDNESPSHHLNKLALCHLLLTAAAIRSMQLLYQSIVFSKAVYLFLVFLCRKLCVDGKYKHHAIWIWWWSRWGEMLRVHTTIFKQQWCAPLKRYTCAQCAHPPLSLSASCVFRSPLFSIWEPLSTRTEIWWDTRRHSTCWSHWLCDRTNFSHNNQCVIIAMNVDANAADKDDILNFCLTAAQTWLRRRKLNFTIRLIFTSNVNSMYCTPRRKRCLWRKRCGKKCICKIVRRFIYASVALSLLREK